MNTTYHEVYPGYPRSWLSPYATVRYTSIAQSGLKHLSETRNIENKI